MLLSEKNNYSKYYDIKDIKKIIKKIKTFLPGEYDYKRMMVILSEDKQISEIPNLLSTLRTTINILVKEKKFIFNSGINGKFFINNENPLIIFRELILENKYNFLDFYGYSYEKLTTGVLVKPKQIISEKIFDNKNLQFFKNYIMRVYKHYKFVNIEFNNKNINYLKLTNYINDVSINNIEQLSLVSSFVLSNNINFNDFIVSNEYKRYLKLFKYYSKKNHIHKIDKVLKNEQIDRSSSIIQTTMFKYY